MNQLLRIHAIWNPHVYHGWGRSKRFFEGWYYKIVNDSQTSAFAIIPGIAMDENGNKQSFIQVLDGMNNIAKYYKFKAEEFKPTPRRHSLKIGENYFSRDEISLDLPNIKGDLKFKNLSPWSNSFLSPCIMGPYSFIPFMECYHGIVSMNHDIFGSLKYNDEDISFNKGKGYMEKDWGHSFPKAYIWMQSNHFTLLFQSSRLFTNTLTSLETSTVSSFQVLGLVKITLLEFAFNTFSPWSSTTTASSVCFLQS